VILGAAAGAMTGNIMASAFITSSSGITFSVSRTQPLHKLFAGSTNGDNDKKVAIETVNDDNMDDLLHPSSNRPVLVDAFAPWCGPCKLLDKVLRKAQPRYEDKVDFVRWNVNDKENTVELKKIFLDSGHTLNKLPSLILFRDGQPTAVRPGFANENQLDFWLENSLPDVLEKTFDEDGLKLLPHQMMTVATPQMQEDLSGVLPEAKMTTGSKSTTSSSSATMEDQEEDVDIKCNDETECLEFLETMVWENRTVVPAFHGILSREKVFSP
jgi:thioredoxin 1